VSLEIMKVMNMLSNSTILINSRASSLGYTLPMTLAKYSTRCLVTFSCDEMKQWEMVKHYASDASLMQHHKKESENFTDCWDSNTEWSSIELTQSRIEANREGIGRI